MGQVINVKRILADRVRHVPSVAALQTVSKLRDGDSFRTYSYYSGLKSGANTYLYHATGRAAAGVTNNGGFHIFGPGADDYFEAIDQSIVWAKQWGAKGRNTEAEDDQPFLQPAMEYAIANGLPFKLEKGTYFVGASLTIDLSVAGKTVFFSGAGKRLSTLKAKTSMSRSAPLITCTGGDPTRQLQRSKFSDFQAVGTKPSGSRLDYILDFPFVNHTYFGDIEAIGAFRAAFRLGYNYSNTWVRCLFQGGQITGNDAWYIYGFVCTDSVNNSNMFVRVDFIQNSIGYLSTTKGISNTFIGCNAEANRVTGYAINGGYGWTWADAYLEANGYGLKPHRFATANQGSTLQGAAYWETLSQWIFSGSLRTCSQDVVTTGSISSDVDPNILTVASATGLFKGAIIEITGAGASGGILYSRILDVSGTQVTIDDNASTTVNNGAVIQPIQMSPDISAAVIPHGINIGIAGWSPVVSESGSPVPAGHLLALGAARNIRIQYPSYATDSPTFKARVEDGVCKIIDTWGHHNLVFDIEMTNGYFPVKDQRWLQVGSPNVNQTPGQVTLAETARFPWAVKDVAKVDLAAFPDPSPGTYAAHASGKYQGKTLYKLTSEGGTTGLSTFTNAVNFGQYPLQGKWVVAEADVFLAFNRNANQAFYNGGFWLYAVNSDGALHSQSAGLESRPATDVITTGSIDIGVSDTTLNVASADGLFIGRPIAVAGALSGGGTLATIISNIVGTTVTLADPATATVASAEVLQPGLITVRKTFKAPSTSTMRMDIRLYSLTAGNAAFVSEIRVREIGNLDY